MSARNTGLFVLGPVSDDRIRAAFHAWPSYAPEHFAGEEAPRVGRTVWQGVDITHIALRVFEVAGLRLMDEDPIPDPTDLEMVLGRELSRDAPVVYAFYEDETMAGGGARFDRGTLTYRTCIDGRVAHPVRRDLQATTRIPDLDPSDWIWPHASRALSAAFADHLTPAPTTDDDLEQLILAANAKPLVPGAAPSRTPEPAEPEAPKQRRRDRLRSRLSGWLGR
jgi:hypothetical protein